MDQLYYVNFQFCILVSLSTNVLESFTNNSVKYSLAQKHCVKISIEKSMVIFSVNLLENLHTISYAILVYIYRGKKMPRLVRGHQPPRAAAGQRGSCAHYYSFILGKKEQRKEETHAFFMFFMYYSMDTCLCRHRYKIKQLCQK